ncbi:MAG: NUDIX domain-containing protein, partial [Thermoleophilia bacterium]
MGCLIFDEQGDIVLVRQTYSARKWALPGGQVEDGESAWQAVVRECHEEIGVVVNPVLSAVY